MTWQRTWRLPVAGMAAAVVLAGCAASQPSTQQNAASSAASRTAAPDAGGPSSGVMSPGSHLTESNPPGDIPDKQVFVAYTPPGAHFSVSVPEGWARTVTGSAVTFTDKLNSITMQELAAATTPTVGSITASVIPDLKRSVPQFTAGKVSSTSRSAGTAVLVTYAGDSAPDPVTNKVVRNAFERYSFWHAGREVVLTLAGPANADNVDPWKTVTDSLRWL